MVRTSTPSFSSCFKIGSSARHGGHQLAKKSTRIVPLDGISMTTSRIQGCGGAVSLMRAEVGTFTDMDEISRLVRERRSALAAMARAEGVSPEDAVDCV